MNEIARVPLPAMTTSEFLAWPGDGTRRRFHLIDGEVQAMSPASDVHAMIQGNMALLLGNAARASRSSLRLLVEGAVIPALTASDNVRVPDLLMAPGETGRREMAQTRPVVVVEILSPGNTPTTRGNVRAYATLASVQEIVVVSTSRMEVELSRRGDDGAWPPDPEVIKPGGQVEVRSVGLWCGIEEVYDGTWLASSSSSR